MTAELTPAMIIAFIEGTYDNIRTDHVGPDAFIFIGDETHFPFATIVTDDRHDPYSRLDAPDRFRLSVGVAKATFQRLFGDRKIVLPDGDTNESGFDFTASDKLMPHPVYGMMWWICVVNPSPETFAGMRPLLDEAAAKATAREAKRQATADAPR
ncbi:MAG: DUF6194 family protein [Bauldia sp.]